MSRVLMLLIVMLGQLALAGAPCRAQVAATVKAEGIEKAEEIQLADVQRKLKNTFGSIERIRKDALPRFQAVALAQLVDQLLVLQSLERDKLAVSSEEVDDEFATLKKTMDATQPGKFAGYLEVYGFTEASRRRALCWEMSWKRHLGRKITSEAIEEHFQKHRRELDGTELRVGHILFKPADPATQADIDALVTLAGKVRQDIASGALSFEDAVTKHSGGTKKDGGDLGFISRQGSMPEPFSRAAFQLDKGGISQPLVSSFGVHLIRCTEEKPGKKTLKDDDVVEEVKLRLRRQLLEEIASRERKKALADPKKPGIQYTGKVPYLKLGTDELIVP